MAVSLTTASTYAIMNFGNKMILDSNKWTIDGSTPSGSYNRTDVCAAHITHDTNQEWALAATGNPNEYYIKSVFNGLCVDLVGGNSTGSAMWGTTCQDKSTQKWVFTALNTNVPNYIGADPVFCISNSASSLVAGSTSTGSNGYTRCGLPVQGVTSNCKNDDKQQWMFFPLKK